MFNTLFHRKYTYKLLYVCLLIFSTTFVFCILATKPGIQANSESTVVNMLNGTASRPYVYRVLLPYIANKINSSIPPQTRDAIALITYHNTTLRFIFSDRHWKINYASEYYIVLLLMYASLWGFVFSFKYFFRGVFKAPERFIDVVLLLTILGFPCLEWPVTYMYDFTTLFLFTLGLATMVRRRWIAYLFVFVLACINKETTILLTCIYAIHFFKHPNLRLSTYIILLLIQIPIYASIKIFVNTIFLHNPGYVVQFWLARNVDLLLQSYSIALYLQWFVLGFLVIYKWSEKPLFLKHGLLILIPLLGTAFFWGWINELRAFYEVYPIVILLISHSMASIFHMSVNTGTTLLTDSQLKNPTDMTAEVEAPIS